MRPGRFIRSTLLRRNVTTMATRKAPAQPLVVVLGSTGTGKSELAVELATRFRGEIINTDAMQLYKGLDIITNKITPAEQQGVPHHLLGTLPLGGTSWNVEEFKRRATQVIGEIRSRGNLPILVGGTQYYVNPLLFKDVILDEVQVDHSKSFPILEESTDVLMKELKKCDPKMADRWHPNERRKIQRSLEIYLSTGRRASELYAEQKERKAAAAKGEEPWESLLLWVYSESSVLQQRLHNRVDRMFDLGLLDEVQELLDFKSERASAGQILDMTKGIWPSIGYKQFEPYLVARAEGKSSSELEALKAQALTEMKFATQRYANYQVKWIRTKQIPLLKEDGPEALNSLYLLNSTDVSQYNADVIEPAAKLTAQFLAGEPRPAPSDVSEVARDVLASMIEEKPKEAPMKRTCDVCRTVLLTEEGWQRHIHGRNHKRVVKKNKRRERAAEEAEAAGNGENSSKSDKGSSDPDVGSLFVT